jgi:hypothetical protein
MRRTNHTAAKTAVGANMRRIRPAIQSWGRPSLRAWASSDIAEEKPPTTKNSGMTWKSQLMTASDGAASSALPLMRLPSSSTATMIAAQCPSATASMATARKKSTDRFRSWLAAAASWERDGAERSSCMWFCPLSGGETRSACEVMSCIEPFYGRLRNPGHPPKPLGGWIGAAWGLWIGTETAGRKGMTERCLYHDNWRWAGRY